jgi:hypothetical protein
MLNYMALRPWVLLIGFLLWIPMVRSRAMAVAGSEAAGDGLLWWSWFCLVVGLG